MTNKIGPNELGKHPEVIKKAQQELLKMDILVCGGCHAIFHFVSEFEEHKENCKGSGNQTKADLKNSWAFTLWKSAQANAATQNPWKLYQSWIGLDSKVQAAWITAGQTIQTISRIGQGTVAETQVKVVRTVTGPVKVADSDAKNEQDSDSIVKADKNVYQKIDNSKPAAPLASRYMVKRTMNSSPSHIEVRECLAERVTSRRYNGRRNTYEYMVKWVDHESTWEPASHFEKGAQELIADCDRKLAKQKAAAAAAAAGASPAGVASPVASLSTGRPERTSKARAVTTLKSWCNIEEKVGAQSAELKRKNTDSDYAEGDSSQDESFGASSSPKKIIKTNTSPGVQRGTAVRYYQKPVNGSPTLLSPSAEVVIDKSGEKVSGVQRKPGAALSPAVKREAQVKVVGKNDSVSSGIVRVAGKAANAVSLTSPTASPPPGSRVQKVIQTTRTPSGQTVKRTVYRTVPATSPSTPAGVPAKAGITRTGATPVLGTRSASQAAYQVNKAGITRQAATPTTPAYKVSPTSARAVRTPVAKPLKAVITPPGRVMRSSPTVSPVGSTGKAAAKTSSNSTASDASTTSADGGDVTLCPVTGKLVSKAEAEAAADADSELQRLLTNEEEAVMQAAAAAGQAQEGAAGGEETAAVGNTQIAELIQNEDGTPVMVTGEDGTVYQVAGKNSEGQTLLFTQGEEGEQQCVIMATPDEGAVAGDGGMAVAGEEGAAAGGGDVAQAMMVDGDSQDGQITAELVQADEPSADGTRRVVLLLPDGNLMVSELNEEQYQQFNLGS